MAQTGYTPILIYSSSTGGNAPAAGSLTNSTLGSELAINITDGKLFYKDNANAVQVIGWKTTPTTAGGTGLTSYTAGDLLYYASGTTLSKLAIGTSGQWLGSSGSAPQWNSPAALTKTDDTNVTLTLGGSASTALLNAASLTLGWTGQLATTRGGTGLSSFTANGVLYASSTSALATGSSLLFDGTAFTVGTTSIGNARIALQASASNDANEPELNFYSAVFANLNKPKAKSANGTLALLLESGSTSTFQKRARLRLDGGGAAQATIQASTDNGSTYVDRVTVDGATGDTTLNTGNLVQGTAAKGVNFTANTPAAGMTSQLLNWYEEGTFTPVVAGSTTAGTATYSLQSASYTRTGRVVYVQVALAWSGGTGTGNLTITGLPFTSANISSVGAMSIALVDALALSANNVTTAFVPANTTRIEIWEYPVGGGAANNVAYDAAATIYLSGSYTV